MGIGLPSAAHFIFIPSVLIIGIAIGWVLGSRAAKDAYAAEAKRLERKRAAAALQSQKADGRNQN